MASKRHFGLSNVYDKFPQLRPPLPKRLNPVMRAIVRTLTFCENKLGDFVLWLIGDRRL